MREHSTHTMERWRKDVAAGKTELGYASWVAAKGLEEDAKESESKTLYGLRFWATARVVFEEEHRFTSLDEAISNASGDFPRSWTIEEIDGDQTCSIYRADNETDPDDAWNGDPVHEVDLRTEGEPFSWEACNIAKDLAKLHPSNGTSRAQLKVDELISRAFKACAKQEETTNG